MFSSVVTSQGNINNIYFWDKKVNKMLAVKDWTGDIGKNVERLPLSGLMNQKATNTL
jgi:hypothetical protein